MSFWTPGRETQLRALFSEGLSGSEIQREMGAETRNVIIGKLTRLGLNRGGRPKPVQAARSTPFRKPAVVPSPPIAPAPPPAPAPGNPCSLVDLTNESCRFPVSEEGAPFLFCNVLEADFIGDVPYCRFHRRIAYRRPGVAA